MTAAPKSLREPCVTRDSRSSTPVFTRRPSRSSQAVVQEDADALGLSLLSGAHNVLVPRIVALLKAAQRDDVLLIVGGIIPEDDITELEAAGVARVFTPGASLEEIGTWLESALDSREVLQ